MSILVPSWVAFVREARNRLTLTRDCGHGGRELLQGHCCHAAMLLVQLVGGTYMRGFYAGPITRPDPFLQQSLERDGSCQHSWVEKDDQILDPTWWQFTDAKLGIYIFP